MNQQTPGLGKQAPAANTAVKRLLLWALLIPLPVLAGPISISVPKIDPIPPIVGNQFSVVVRVTNSANSPAHIALSVSTDMSSRMVALVPANGAVIEVMTGVFNSPGPHTLDADAYVAVLVNGNYVFPSGFHPIPVASSMQTLSAATAAPALPAAVYVGPNDIAGGDQVWSSGVIQRVVGDDQTLFAVSKTAGVWRFTAREQVWTQLPGPPKAFSIAIDPTTPGHLVVGERSDDVSDEALGFSGLWQSVDSGETWTFLYNPFMQTSSQAIPAVAISPATGTLFFATVKGVARWGAPQSQATVAQISYPTSASGGITAIAIDASRVWARTASAVMHSENDGLTWESDTLPTAFALPQVGTLAALYDENGNGAGNDRDSLAAFEDEAFMTFKPDTSSFTGTLKKKWGNRSPLLIYRPDQPKTGKWTAQWTLDNDGRGLGGTRLVRAYHLPCSSIPDSIGQRRQVFYDAGEGVQQAVGESNGTLTFATPIDAKGVQGTGNINVHTDWWDFLFQVSGCQIAHQPAWVANDGGVFRTELNGSGHLTTSGWKYSGSGLQTHNINGLAALPRADGQAPFLAYATTDNSGWYRDDKAKWHAQGFMGDANYVAADGASPLALIWRQLWGNHSNQGVITGFGSSFPGSNGSSNEQFELYNDADAPKQPLDGPSRVQPIPPGPLESVASGALDVALLIRAPLLDEGGHPLKGRDAIGNPGPQPNPPQPILIRNPKFAHHPSASSNKFKDWYWVSNLPAGATRFWPTNGLANTTYYVEVNTPDCPSNLWLLQGVNNHCVGTDYQLPLIPEDSSGLSPPYGPVFVNPLRQQVLLAVFTRAGQMQVGFSRDGGVTMCSDPTLAALLTQSGRLPLPASSGPAETLLAVGSNYHGKPTQLNPTSVAFDRDDPTRVIVASPYGVIVTAQISADVRGGDCQLPTWFDLTESLASIPAYISTVQIANHLLFVGTEGQGVQEVSSYTSALLAAWVEPPQSQGFPQTAIAILHDGAGNTLPFSRATAQLQPISPCSSTTVISLSLRSDAGGNLFPPSPIPACTYVATVAVANDGSHASAITKFRYTVN
jgi:hypothetical protein